MELQWLSWAEWIVSGTGDPVRALPGINKPCLCEISSDIESPLPSHMLPLLFLNPKFP